MITTSTNSRQACMLTIVWKRSPTNRERTLQKHCDSIVQAEAQLRRYTHLDVLSTLKCPPLCPPSRSRCNKRLDDAAGACLCVLWWCIA